MSTEKRKRRSTRTPPVNDSSSENELVIDLPSTSTGGTRTRSLRPMTPKKSPDKRQPSSRRKRRRARSSSSSSEVEDQTLEETIQRVALSNNMSQESIKKILKKLVLNEHILATVKLKEEEEERKENVRKDEMKDGMEGDDEDEEQSIKLTRLKAKQLNKPPLPIAPLKVPIPDDEVTALIREELNSDDDDEEYKPTEDDIPSDDDHSTTMSDLDSLPRTPVAPSTPGGTETEPDPDEPAMYTRDGLFKIPRMRNDSQCSHSEQENIARRTRSKLCLQTTAIETIESTFFPPDITTDMYDFDCDMDHVWKEFLSEFTKPLPNHAEEDDDTDPEYVAADQEPVDREELREVKVSKKELNELVSELLEMSGIMDGSFLNDDLVNSTVAPEAIESSIPTESSKIVEETGQSSVLNTPQMKQSSPMKERSVSPTETGNFQPNTMSTPTVPPAENRIIPADIAKASGVALPVAQSILHPITPATQRTEARLVLVSSISQSNTSSINVMSTNSGCSSAILNKSTGNDTLQTNLSIANDTLNATSKSFPLNGQFFIQISTPDESSFTRYCLPSLNVPVVPPEERVPVSPSERKYRFTHSLVPITVTYNEGQTGFTNFQLQIFQQQLRQHVQFAAQNFMQTYAHPKFWKMANTFKDMLLDLQRMSHDNPSAKAWNLDGAVECCLSWEKDLANDTDENKEFIQFQIDEVSKGEKAKASNKYYQGFFHPKMMEHVVNNPVFMYPKLLPYTPFRTDLRSETRFIKAEERLIAFGLDMFYSIAKQELNKHKPTQEKHPTVIQVCRYISKYLIPLQTDKQLYTYINSRRQRSDKMNPIKYYFQHSKGPIFQHVLEGVDFTNVLPPVSYQKGELPHLWDKYIYSKERLVKLNASKGDPEIVAIHESVQAFSKQSKSAAVVQEPPALNITISVVLDPNRPPIPLDQTVCTPEKNSSSVHIRRDRLEDLTVSESHSKDKSECSATSPYVVEIKEESSISIDDDTRDLADFEDHTDVSITGSVSDKSSCCECNCHYLDNSHRSNCRSQRKENSVKGQKRLTDYFTPTKNVSSNDSRKAKLKEKLWEIYQRFCDSCVSSIDVRRFKQLLLKVYNHFRLIEGFSYFLVKLKELSFSHGAKAVDGIMAKNEHSVSNEVNNRTQRSNDCGHRDANYAYNFFEKVEETLLSENKHVIYEHFLDILQSFNTVEDRVSDLYCKIENLLIMEHPELVDMFLTFLLPGQAAEVGRFFEHFILTNANDFLTKLNIYFAKQPAQIKKIYSCLNELSNEPDVTMEHIKSRILPLLKGNPLLIEWFLQLFPPERPPDSNISDYEVISTKKLPHPDPADPDEVYEEVPFVDVAPETIGEGTVCGTKYIQGRIMYGTQPARLTFLAHNCMSVSSKQKEKPGLKGCVHNVCIVDSRPPKPSVDGETSDKEQQAPDNLVQEEIQQRDDAPRYKLCDEATFNAHAIRLNPLVHGRKGITYADVAHLLVPDPNAAEESQLHLDDDKSNSPKKQQVKTVPKKRISSPVNKKSTAGKNSPTACKKPPITVSPDSKVIATSKKLKNLIESTPVLQPNAEQPSLGGVKRKANTIGLSSNTNVVGTTSTVSTTEPATLPVKKERTESSDPKASSSESSGCTSWTREEDKVILEEIKLGYNSVEQLVERIGARIEGRSTAEIRQRYEFLMEVLKKFQKSN